MRKNLQLADEDFEMAITEGSAKAALALGDMCRYDFSGNHPSASRKKQMAAIYTFATGQGGPDAYAALAECQDKGMGMKKDQKQPAALKPVS